MSVTSQWERGDRWYIHYGPWRISLANNGDIDGVPVCSLALYKLRKLIDVVANIPRDDREAKRLAVEKLKLRARAEDENHG